MLNKDSDTTTTTKKKVGFKQTKHSTTYGKAMPAKALKRDDKPQKGEKDALAIKYTMINGKARQAVTGLDEQHIIRGENRQKHAPKENGRNN